MQGNKLEIKEVAEISGRFIVEAYQRGYRWGDVEVRCLLDDIYSGVVENKNNNTYCLQPIVVKKTADNDYELIDGQQRLTTIYIIYKYISFLTNGSLISPNILINYKTRVGSQQYLETLNPSHSNDYIDYYYMYNAYKTVENWFENKAGGDTNKRSKIAWQIHEAFSDKVKVIWYEVENNEDSEKLFARLNIGRIPLTCAELTKAMFLSRVGGLSNHKQNEIALQWDVIERELRDNSLWYFLTNKSEHDNTTRIELVLDLMAGKTKSNRDKLFTFLKFAEREKNGEKLKTIWRDINSTFLLLKGWYHDNELYHKIGFLITQKTSLDDIYRISKGKTKSEFNAALDDKIRACVSKAKKNYGEMTYISQSDYDQISLLLVLFNVMSVFKLGDRFPFDKFKNTREFDEKGNEISVRWSLEHIHAQHSQGLSTVKEWQAWIREHIVAVKIVSDQNEDLVNEMTLASTNDKLSSDNFNSIHDRVVKILTPNGEISTLHNISNLAILNTRDNAALNDSTFAVKRRKIIERDSNGKYIPFCTKMVFLKYYSPDAPSMYYWSEADRTAYIDKINDLLYTKCKYLKEKIIIDKEDSE